jgi:hypothetical protein
MFHWLTTMYGQRVESSSPRSSGDSNRFGPTRVSLPHDICRSMSVDPNLHISTLTQILQNGNQSSATREHSTHFTMSFIPDRFTEVCYMVLSPSLHSQCAVAISQNEIAKIYWAYRSMWLVLAKSQLHTGLQRTVPNRHRRGHYVKPQTWCKPRFHLVSI